MSLKPWLEDYSENNKDNKRGKLNSCACSFRIRTLNGNTGNEGCKRNGGSVSEWVRRRSECFLQSDVKEVAEDMRDKFEKFGNGKFVVDDG